MSQTNKDKVRPVLDLKQLNEFISCHTGGSSVCDDTIRRWRKLGGDLALLDLRKAYLQIHVDRSQWKHQVVQFKGRYYYLTRVAFGLSSAPRIMSKILEAVLRMDNAIRKASDNYLDDIIVNESLVPAETVRRHLQKYGLMAKAPEKLRNGTKVLGLWVSRSSNGDMIWKRASPPPLPSIVEATMTRRQLFSICGQLVGHHPVAGHLRVACSYIKRISEGRSWEDDIGDDARRLLKEMLCELRHSDPVTGRWAAESKVGKVWCDASSLAVGCALEIDGAIVEDASWIRKKDDGTHINMAELDSVLRGLNLAVKWGLKKIDLLTDSATVLGWLKSVFLDTHTIRTRGMNEILVKRRLAVIKDVCSEFNLEVAVRWVASLY